MPRDFKKSFSGPKYGGKSFGGGGSSYGRKPSGGDSYGGRGGSRDGGFDRPTMHSATCAECGSHCEVPFKPNGKKPILCSNCFKRDGGEGPKRFDAPRSDRPSFDRPSFNDRAPARSGQDEAAMRAINEKLDKIIEILGSMNE